MNLNSELIQTVVLKFINNGCLAAKVLSIVNIQYMEDVQRLSPDGRVHKKPCGKIFGLVFIY